jgi:seryl-tRNA synthetase
MLKEVEAGMDQVKELYGRKVDRVDQERRVALKECSDLQRQLDGAEAAAKSASDSMQQELAAAMSMKSEAIATAEQHRAAAKAAEERVVEVEHEMRALLEAFERERAESAVRAKKVQEFMQLWQH